MKTFFTAIALFIAPFAFSQHYPGSDAKSFYSNASEIRYDNRSAAPLFIAIDKKTFIPREEAFKEFKNVLSIQPADHFKLIRESADAKGNLHSRYQQYYQGVKVINGEYILHEEKGGVVSANGFFYTHLKLNVKPTISEIDARKNAINNIGASVYKWEVPGEEKLKKQIEKNSYATFFPKGELVIVTHAIHSKIIAPVLCWKYDVYAHEPMSRHDVYVDANNGTIVFKENKVCTGNANGSGNTKYSGTQNFVTDSFAMNNYRLQDASRSAPIKTYNLQNGINYGSAIDFTDSDNVWTSTLNQNNAALDAHWGAQKTFDYFLTVHGRNSFDNAGGAIISYVHYGTSYNNAYWNGSAVTYGDGDGINYSPLTELDMVGHELSHGVTQYASGLNYSYESGALNESFSDIFGKSIDFWINPSTAAWKLGRQCYTPAIAGDALRHFDNPNAGGQPDTYQGTNWYNGTGDNGGVHTNSGVQNFWYYLLVNGGTGTNDNGLNYSVSGIGLIKASQIAYRCNETYLTSGSQYVDAAFYSIQSARDLFGNCSPEVLAVKNAWDAVGINNMLSNPNATASLMGAGCLGGTLQFNAGGGVTYSWSGPDNFISTDQNPVIINAKATATGTYNCVIVSADGCTDLIKVNIIVNTPPTVSTTPLVASMCAGNSVSLNANANVSKSGLNTGTNNTAIPIPDYPGNGVLSPINISGALNASNMVSVTIDSLRHTWDSDLDIKLIAPNGSFITLVSGAGGGGQNFFRTVFTSSASTPVSFGTAPFTGSYLPQQPFSQLSGTANGTWNIKITDLSGQDIGTLYKWSITLSPNVITAYSWSPGVGLNDSTSASVIATPASTVTYAVTVTDAIGCTAKSSSQVYVSSLKISDTTVPVTCYGSMNGSIDLTATGGLGKNNFNWSNNSTSEDQAGLTTGIYYVTVTDSIGCVVYDTVVVSQPDSLTLTVNTVNENCGLQDGSATAMISGGMSSYSYLWSNASTTAGINNLSAGTYTVTVSDINNCSSSKSINIINSGASPAPPSPISGQPGACRNQTNVMYSVTPVPGAVSYTWTPPAGTTFTINNNQISVNFGAAYVTGNLCVRVNTTCGQSVQTCLSIPYISAKPLTPGAIVGSKSPCPNTTVAYSVTPVARTFIYNWVAPPNASIISGQGTNAVEIAFNAAFVTGNVSVNAANCFGISGYRNQKVQSLPTAPASISGAVSNLCSASGIIYSTPASTTGATFYTWTVSPNATIVSGQGTTSATVNFATTPTIGNVCVSAGNVCGSSVKKCLATSLLALKPAIITGPSTVCSNQTNLAFSVVAQSGVIYNWTVPAGASVTSGQGTASVIIKWGTVAGNVSVVARNNCGNQSARTKAITINCRSEQLLSLSSFSAELIPNPAHEAVKLLLKDVELPCRLTLVDMLGKFVYSTDLTNQESVINLNGFAEGMYFVQLKNNSISKTLRLVVQ